MIKCPLCQNSSNRVIFRPHWSKKYHEFICGHCKMEFSLFYNDKLDIDTQLKNGCDRVLLSQTGMKMYELVDQITKKVNGMTEDEMKERLDELNAVYH